VSNGALAARTGKGSEGNCLVGHIFSAPHVMTSVRRSREHYMENGEEDLEPLDDLDLGLEFGDLLGFENHKGDYVSMEFS